jgi:hypothetical protein
MADMTAPVKPATGAGAEAMAAYSKALDAYTKAQEAKAKAADAAGKKIEAAPYTPVDTTGKPAAPVSRATEAPYQAQIQGKAASTPFMAPPPPPAPIDPVATRLAKMDADAATDPAVLGSAVGGRGGPASVPPPPAPEQGIITPTQFSAPKEYAPGEQRTGVENPKFYPQTIDSNPLVKAGVAPKKASTIDAMIAKLDAESKSGGPNIADFIEAAAAGWNGRKAAYLEKEAKKADVKADLEKLAKTATMEKELQDERLAAEEKIAGIKAMGGVGNLNLTPGQAAAAKLMAGLGGQ